MQAVDDQAINEQERNTQLLKQTNKSGMDNALAANQGRNIQNKQIRQHKHNNEIHKAYLPASLIRSLPINSRSHSTYINVQNKVVDHG
jgi:hypothetical protein